MRGLYQQRSTDDPFATHLVAIHQGRPTRDKSFAHQVLLLCFGIAIVIQHVRYPSVDVLQKGAKPRSRELVEQLIEAILMER